MRRLTMLILAALLVGAACSSGLDQATEAGGTAETIAGDLAAAPEGEAEPVARADEAAYQDPFPFSLDQRIIREARLELRVEEGSFQEQWDRLRSITAGVGGYLSDAQVGTEQRGDTRYTHGTVTVRIPVENFDDTLAEISEIGERISLSMSSQDVTEEYVDLESRLRHWQAVEAFHLELLDRAQTVEEALKVQAQLSQIQLTIEQIQGRLRYLSSRTEFATLSVFMTELPGPLPIEVQTDKGELAEALEQARQVLLGTFGLLIVAAAAVFPLALLGLVSYGLWRLGRRMAPRSTGEA